ncbi:MAG TPA: hypothetical protein VG248_05840 [Caulobacteraceae bacterium]|jgi:hypothetical protein|nr:hypothetical protein [Caulobacteraceae bacterium]
MTPYLTAVAFGLHILGGMVGVVAAFVALCAQKGGRMHRRAGTVFVVAMLSMAAFAAVLAVIRPGQIINLCIAGLTAYLVATGWLTVRRRGALAGPPEWVALGTSVLLCAPFALMIFQIATGVVLFKSAFAIKGAILVALSVFAAVVLAAALGDLGVVRRGISGTSLVARHLWRMCFGSALALGSAFTNGFARLLPGPYHVPPAFFAPQLLMLGVLIFWLVRIRFPGWAASGGRAAAASQV